MYQFLHLILLFLWEVTPRVSGGSSKPIASGWYADWSGVALAEIPWAKYTHMAYAFAIPTKDPTKITVDAKGLTDFVTTARDNNVSPLLAIGGWAGSRYFSTAVSTEENRDAFMKAILTLVTNYHLDGIDFDWEYPDSADGQKCNIHDPTDSAYLLSLLQELHKQNESLTLTAAVSGPFLGKDGNPIKDVSAFADVLNRIEVMAYDLWPSSTVVGPNAPLNASCAPLAYQKFGSVESMVNAWTHAQFPPEKIVLGLASYGYSYSVNSAAETDNTIQPYPTISGPFAVPTPTPTPNKCSDPSSISGMSTFSDLVNTGYLDSTGNAGTSPGIVYTFDTCSQTPFIYNRTSSVMVSYDDATSFAAKGKYIVDNGLAGFAVWDAAGDYKGILLDSVRKATGMA